MYEKTKMSLSPFSALLSRPYEHNKSGYNRFSRSMLAENTQLHQKDLKGHFGCVNALEFSNKGGDFIISGGDDRRVLLWKYEEALSGRPPQVFKARHFSNIFCLAFDNENTRVLSGGNDEQVVVHDVETGKPADVYRYDEAVYCLSVDPINSNVFASAADDGQVLIYDMRAPVSEDPFVLVKTDFPMHAVMYNPAEPRVIATANSKQGLCLWDIRQPKSCLIRYGGRQCKQSAMSVRISQDGRHLIALRRRLPPILYNIDSPLPIAQFDHPGYYNSCAMKTCCFAGDKDQFLLSGSDDNNVYMWKIPEQPVKEQWQGKAHAVLQGHRSLVNQVRYNTHHQCIISSGVEKVVKVWSPLRLPNSLDDVEPRLMYSHEEYINLVLRSGELMSQDTLNQNTEEDPRMFAFFDSLVQRELEGWSSEEQETGDDNDDDVNFYSRFVASSTSSDSAGDSDTRSEVYSPFTRAFASVIASHETQNFPSLQELTEAAENSQDSEAEGVRNGVTERDSRAGISEEEEEEEAGTRQDTAGSSSEMYVNSANTVRASNEGAASNVPSSIPVISLPFREGSVDAPRPSRGLTVTELILSKRQEYLSGIRKQEARIRQRRRLHLRRCRIRLGWAMSESSSSDDDSPASSSGSSNHEYQTAVDNTLDRLRDQRRQFNNLERMGRLRYLRSQLAEDEETIGGTSRQGVVPADMTTEEGDGQVVVDGIIGLPDNTSSQFTVLHNAIITARDTGTSLTHCGVHTDSVPPPTSHKMTNGESSHTDSIPAASGLSNGETGDCPLKGQVNGVKADCTDQEENAYCNGDVRECDGSDREIVNGEHEGGAQPSASNEPEPSTSTASDEPSTSQTWTHFKRFKNNVEKVRRNYRKRHHPDDQ